MTISNSNYNSRSSGFTLVETLIAVAILMIAIAGPLTIANQALTSALGSRNAMIATYLAQDGMESIKNIKDNNLTDLAGFAWSNIINTSCTVSSPCSTPQPFNYIGSDANNNIICTKVANCKLFTNDSKKVYFYGGDSTNGDHPTPFTRYYYVNLNGNEAVVTVVVSWTDGSVPNEIRLQELMTNSTR